MEFKVSFEQPAIVGVKGSDLNSVFPPHVKRITVETTEPACPFCNRMLKNAMCSCRRYDEALKRFKIRHYGTEKINIRAYEIKVVNCYNFERQQVEFSKVSDLEALSIYPRLMVGETCNLSLYGTWVLTTATYENGKLKFYYTKKGDNSVYKCQISLPDFKPLQYKTIEFYRLEQKYVPRQNHKPRLGGYQITFHTTVVATIGYAEFLKKLQKKK